MYAATRLFNRRTIVGFALLLLIMAVAYGFAAANTVGNSSAGDGTGLISGYAISNVSYTLDNTDPRYLTSVSFTMADDGSLANGVATVPTTIKIGFPTSADPTASAANWFPCTPPTSFADTVSCTVTANTIRVYDINFLRVVAVK